MLVRLKSGNFLELKHSSAGKKWISTPNPNLWHSQLICHCSRISDVLEICRLINPTFRKPLPMNHIYCFDSISSRGKRFCYGPLATRIFAFVCLNLAVLVVSPCGVFAQGALVNGSTTSGTISPAGDSDTWT